MNYFILILLLPLYFYNGVSAQSLFSELNKKFVGPNEVVASIDTIAITAEEFFYNYEFGPVFTKRQKNSKEIHLNYMINEKLLALEGYKDGVMNKDDTKIMYFDIQSDIATEELFKDSILSKVEYSDFEINKVVNQKNIELEIRWIYTS